MFSFPTAPCTVPYGVMVPRGLIPGWTARPDDPVAAAEARAWCWAAGVDPALPIGPAESRGDFLAELDRKVVPP